MQQVDRIIALGENGVSLAADLSYVALVESNSNPSLGHSQFVIELYHSPAHASVGDSDSEAAFPAPNRALPKGIHFICHVHGFIRWPKFTFCTQLRIKS